MTRLNKAKLANSLRVLTDEIIIAENTDQTAFRQVADALGCMAFGKEMGGTIFSNSIGSFSGDMVCFIVNREYGLMFDAKAFRNALKEFLQKEPGFLSTQSWRDELDQIVVKAKEKLDKAAWARFNY